jgi:regulatory protein YycI of two-component signal transduction system YycFG
MDWTKAKSILIVALLVTNLVLITTYFLQNGSQKDDDKEMQNATVKLLEQKNIFVNTDIPQEHPRMAKLTVRYDKMNETTVKEQLAAQKALTDPAPTDDELISMTSEFIRKCNLMTENVTFGSLDRTGADILVTYKNYIKGIAIEDSYIICTVRDGKIVDFKRYWLNPVETGSMEKEVIPAGAALIKFMGENTAKEKIYVEGITLVYWLDSSAFDAESPVTDTAFPAWKITYNNGKSRYIPAWEQ